MQIPPSNSLLQALSGSAPQATSRAVRPAQSEAARAAARAVFSQLKAPTTPTTTVVAPPQTAVPTQTVTAASPGRSLPRGSIINILV